MLQENPGNDSFTVIEVGPGIKWTLSAFLSAAQAFCDALYSAHYASSENQCWMPESDSDSYNLLASVKGLVCDVHLFFY